MKAKKTTKTAEVGAVRRVSISLPPELVERLEAEARAVGGSVSEVVRRALLDALGMRIGEPRDPRAV